MNWVNLTVIMLTSVLCCCAVQSYAMQDNDGLHIALEESEEESAIKYIAEGYSIHKPTSYGVSPLLRATYNELDTAALIMLALGADPMVKYRDEDVASVTKNPIIKKCVQENYPVKFALKDLNMQDLFMQISSQRQKAAQNNPFISCKDKKTVSADVEINFNN